MSTSFGQGSSHPFDPSRGTRNSILQKVTMPESSSKWIGIPISLCQLESEPRSLGSPPERSVLFCQARFRLLRCPSSLERSPDVAEKTKVVNGYPCRNSSMYPRFLLQLEKNHETFPSLRDEARFPCIACRAMPCSQSNR